ncbi:MAG: hypothetical protein M3220_14495 [Chloroflexota bacterium]|nr:hypothetical protein [Chloroflexota bacterium]
MPGDLLKQDRESAVQSARGGEREEWVRGAHEHHNTHPEGRCGGGDQNGPSGRPPSAS